MLDEDVHVLGSHYLTNVAYHEVKETLFVAAVYRGTQGKLQATWAPLPMDGPLI